ncbi:hypothetical protein D9611_010186 [Ephemerocybe angulata]|uniref:Uncharacterized protein n=2 Tax=Ephemerocybe angulata TaxID=980116 RepID=A0A8H5AZ20_9AGAR|nr:hypothetical protein D9611_010186 [Tulosesus angulatus]
MSAPAGDAALGDLDTNTDTRVTPPSKKRVAMGHFMTPVRQILFRLEWSKSTKKRKGKVLVKPPKKGVRESRSSRPLEASSTDAHPPTSDISATPRISHTHPVSSFPSREHDHDHDHPTSADESDSDIPPSSSPDHTHPPRTYPPPKRGRVAIQQHDPALDAIVVTTLPEYPFYTHEDLLRMSRAELLSVARALNARLPAHGQSQIPVDGSVLESVVRARIEVLVGILPPVPMAPKAVKCVPSLSVAMDVDGGMDRDGGGGMEEEEDDIPSPPTSPLAMKEKRMKGSHGAAAAAAARRLANRIVMSEEEGDNDDDGEDEGMDVTVCLSPRRFLEPLDEEDEEEEEEEEEEEFYEEDEEMSHLFDGHTVKRRRVSPDGAYARILAVERGRTVVAPPSTQRTLPLPFASPVGQRYKFSVPRKPVMRALLDAGDSRDEVAQDYSEKRYDPAGGATTTIVASDSIEVLFGGKAGLHKSFQSSLIS